MQMINFGCGLSVTPGWQNFDASPTLRLQRLPLVGHLARSMITPLFPADASYGDVVRGLPVGDEMVDRVYSSHVLEHLALDDFRKALIEVLRVLKPGGVFRAVVPDLEREASAYLSDRKHDACSRFMQSTYLGVTSRQRGLSGLARSFFGNSQHLWMWDFSGIAAELVNAGFNDVRRAVFADSKFPEFTKVEELSRWDGCLGFECVKPG